MYAVVYSSVAYVYVETQGTAGSALGYFDDIETAEDYAAEMCPIADVYIVDTSAWAIVD